MQFDVEEKNETEELYSVMDKRILECKSIASGSYGPPDICYLVKESKGKSFLGLGLGTKKVNKYGSYHYVYGMNSTNLAYVSCYIGKIVQKLQTINKELKITQSVYCCFDYFEQKDLRILIKFPGGVLKVFYIDDQNAIEVNVEECKTLLLSCFIRSQTLKEVNNNSYYQELEDPEAFNTLWESIFTLISENSEYKYPNLKYKIKVLLNCYVNFLINTRRFNISIINFSKLTTIDNTLVKYVIKPLNILELYEDALNYLGSVLLYNPSAAYLLSYEVNLLVNLNKLDDAHDIAKFITSIHPEKANNWLCLANVYLKRKYYDKCFRALNNVYFLKDFSVKIAEEPNNLILKE